MISDRSDGSSAEHGTILPNSIFRKVIVPEACSFFVMAQQIAYCNPFVFCNPLPEFIHRLMMLDPVLAAVIPVSGINSGDVSVAGLYIVFLPAHAF